MHMTCNMIRVLLLILMLPLAGCRIVNYYAYKPIQEEILGGTLEVNVIGGYGENYEQSGIKRLDWGFPYFLQFSYVVPNEDGLSNLEINNIILVAENSGEKYSLSSVQSDDVRSYGRGNLIRVSAGPLTADEYSYQNYTLSAELLIHSSPGNMQSQEIIFHLETDFRTEKRSDQFDEVTSI